MALLGPGSCVFQAPILFKSTHCPCETSGEEEWKSATCVLIESMEEKAAYIHGGQGAWQGC
jgi:hypothetical protein